MGRVRRWGGMSRAGLGALAVGAAIIAAPGGRAALAAGDDDAYATPLVPMRPEPLDRSLAELLAEGWQVAGVTLAGRTLHYHLVREGALTVCAVDTGPGVPASRCVRLDPARH